MEAKKRDDYLRFWLGSIWKNEHHEKTVKLSWNEYQHLLKCLRDYKNKTLGEQNGKK